MELTHKLKFTHPQISHLENETNKTVHLKGVWKRKIYNDVKQQNFFKAETSLDS